MKVEPYTFGSFGDAAPSQPEADFVGNGAKPDKKKKATEIAEQKGYERGYVEGNTAGAAKGQAEREQLQQVIIAMQQSIEGKLLQFEEQFEKLVNEKHNFTLTLAKKIAEKVAGSALKEFPEEKVLDTVKKSMDIIYGEDKIAIKVASDIADILKDKIVEIVPDTNIGKKITVVGEGSISGSDCCIEWESGKAVASQEVLLEEIDKVIAQLTL